MRLRILSAIAMILGLRFKVAGVPYGISPPPIEPVDSCLSNH